MMSGLVAVLISVSWATTPGLVTLEDRALASVERAGSIALPSFVMHGATVFTATGAVYAPGYVVVRDGRIAAVGAGAPPSVPDVEVVDASGKFLTPGIIDTHSHLGVYPSPQARAHSDGNEAVSPNTSGVWAEHGVWPQDPNFDRALAGGVTTLQVLPGSANLIGGRGVTLQNVPASGARAMRFPGAPETVKLACGENPKRVYGDKGGPSTRMGNVAGHRAAFIDAAAYAQDWRAYDAKVSAAATAKNKRKAPDLGDPPKRNLGHETLAGVLEGRVLPQIHCYRADDMLSVLQIADEFGFEVRSFHHAVEAYKIRDVLAERKVAVSTWADWWGFKLEAWDAILENAALVHAAGGIAVIHSDSSIGIQRLNQETAKAYYAGLRAGLDISEDDAIRWMTANAAWVLGIDAQTGSLVSGKRADLVMWDAHPFSAQARAQRVYIEGRLVHDHSAPLPRSDFVVGVGGAQ